MPVNVPLLRQQIDAYATRSTRTLTARQALLDGLVACFAPGFDADALLAAALTASRIESKRHWSGALHTCNEPINSQVPFGSEPAAFALIASDGSQILPDRHKPLLFAYVQAACACMVYGYADHPQAAQLAETIQRAKPARILSEDDFESGENVNPAAEVSNIRDVMEIELLADACARFAAIGVRPIVIADGSIVPFALLNERTLSNPAQASKLLNPLIKALDTMRAAGALVAGYIDRPNSTALVRACALNGRPLDAITMASLEDDAQRLAGITDRLLIERVLATGRRSALFDPNWLVNGAKHLGEHEMRACYVNLGAGLGDSAIIARLELPQWCANAESLASLTGIIARHAGLSAEAYPFILKAAHEEAVISKDDQREIENALEQELLNRGVRVRYSPKQAAKDLR
jgi:hypothetical protein